MGGIPMLQHNSFGVPDYLKFSDDGSAREQALADHGDRMRCLPCGAPMHACVPQPETGHCSAAGCAVRFKILRGKIVRPSGAVRLVPASQWT